jgi:hypothetical protein
MGTLDKRSAAIPLNTFRQDYNIIAFVGGRGGGGGVPTGVTRYTYWLDCDPFDVYNRSMISQNLTFQIFADSGLTTPLLPYIIVDQSDDIPDEQVKVGATSQGASVILAIGQPPYYLNTKFTSQPANANFQNDQGRYSMAGYVGFGTGFGGTQMVGQAFVPKQSKLTGFFWAELFHTNTTDHTKFFNVNFELWNSNKQFVAHLGTLQPTYNSAVQPSGLTTDNVCTAFCNNLSYNTCDDSVKRWITLNNLAIQLNTPVNVTPGQTYYLIARLATLSTTNYYFLGNNTNSSSLLSGLGRYTAYDQTGVAVSAHAIIAADGSSTFSNLVDANSNPVDFPFITQGNTGRIAVTFWWGNNPGAYWAAPPSSFPDSFKFIHLNFDQRI